MSNQEQNHDHEVIERILWDEVDNVLTPELIAQIIQEVWQERNIKHSLSQ